LSLANIFLELKRRARDTGDDRTADLKGGARLAVRVQADVVTLTISRSKKPLGATELETFRRDCGIPASAIRFPLDEQGTRTVDGVIWWYIAYRWREGAE
jgi:hypothetical protein